MKPGDMHQHEDDDEREALGIIGFAITYASGFLMGFLVAAWVML